MEAEKNWALICRWCHFDSDTKVAAKLNQLFVWVNRKKTHAAHLSRQWYSSHRPDSKTLSSYVRASHVLNSFCFVWFLSYQKGNCGCLLKMAGVVFFFFLGRKQLWLIFVECHKISSSNSIFQLLHNLHGWYFTCYLKPLLPDNYV